MNWAKEVEWSERIERNVTYVPPKETSERSERMATGLVERSFAERNVRAQR